MATKFLEPGGDATFNVAATTAGGFWSSINTTPAIVTDFVHGNHIKSIQFRANNTDWVVGNSILADAGSRISLYIYLVALPATSKARIIVVQTLGATSIVSLFLTTAGTLQLWTGAGIAQMGSDGSTLSTGIWYRICIAYTITDANTNEFRVFKNGSLDITVSNTAGLTTASSSLRVGNVTTNTALDFRASDFYVDNSSSLTDTGDIWVTAKRPNANGTTNGFTTQIGSGGSGYGTGHSSQVNERIINNANGWSMVGAGSAITEEYNIESKSAGDIDISAATIIDWLGWADMKSLAGETVQVILDGANNAQAITSTETLYTKIKGSTTYPSGTGADIGITTDTSLTTVSLYECGVVVAYIPATATVNVPYTNPNLKALLQMGIGT